MGPELVEYLKYEVEDSGIAWITFNRPERRNALMGNSQERSTVAKVGEYMRAADDDPDVRVIVLTGEGQGFCSGADTPGELTGCRRDPHGRGQAFSGGCVGTYRLPVVAGFESMAGGPGAVEPFQFPPGVGLPVGAKSRYGYSTLELHNNRKIEGDASGFPREEVGEVLSDDLLPSIPQRFAPGIVDLDEIAIGLKRLVAQWGVVKHGPKPFLAFKQCPLGLLALGYLLEEFAVFPFQGLLGGLGFEQA